MFAAFEKPVVLVTGGHGFIGHHLVKALLQTKAEVVVIDNHTIYPTIMQQGKVKEHIELIEDRILALGAEKPYVAIEGDVRESWEELLTEQGVDPASITHVVHLANIPRQAEAQVMPNDTADIMAQVIKLNDLPNLRNAVFISSSMIYGNFSQPATEADFPRPTGMYGSTRLVGEHLFRALMEAHPNRANLASHIIRPTAVYGPLDSTIRVVGKFVEAALKGEPLHVRGEGELMDFTYVADVVRGILLAVDTVSGANGTSPGLTYCFNISRGIERVTLLDLAKSIVALTESSSPIVIEGKDTFMPSRHLLDTSQAESLLGYISEYALAEGLPQVIEDLHYRRIATEAALS